MQVNKAHQTCKTKHAKPGGHTQQCPAVRFPYTRIQPNAFSCMYNLSTGPSAARSLSRVLWAKTSSLRTKKHWCCDLPAAGLRYAHRPTQCACRLVSGVERSE